VADLTVPSPSLNTQPTRKRSRQRGTGSIFRQLGCTTWTLQYYRNGKRIREATGETDKRAAQQLLNQRLHQVDKGEPIPIGRRKQIFVKELHEGLERDYRQNGQRTLDKVQRNWKLHLAAFFADMPATNVTKETILRYRDERLQQGAARATINREMAALKTAFYLAADKLPSLPVFPAQLKENNTRTGFVEDADYERLAANASELWLRLYLELGFTYGWRKGELLNLRVRHVNLANRKIRLDPGTTKNDEGREVVMTAKVAELLRLAVAAKRGDDFVLTRDAQRGRPAAPVRDFRAAWRNLCIKAGLGKFVCRNCGHDWASKKCGQCGGRSRKWIGQIPHDLRRSAAKALRAAGVAESVVMSTGGWKTRQMFERYAIVSSADQRAAVEMLEQQRLENSRLANSENSHDFSHDSVSSTPVDAEAMKARPN
jgi:integrase